VRTGDLYRVLPAAAAANLPGVASTDAMPGSVVVPLRYVSAADLAKVLQPVIGPSAKIVADPGQNAILVGGDPEARNALVGLVRSFDVDMLAGQSYALLPVPQGANPKDFATTLQDAFRGHTGGGLTGLADLVRVLPLEHAGAVLVVASEPRYVAAAQRVFQVLDIEPAIRDMPGAWPLRVSAGELRFEEIRFGYHPATIALDGISLTIRHGEAIGVASGW